MDEAGTRARALLDQLIATWPWDGPDIRSAAFSDAVDIPCVVCRAELRVNDLAVVLELEMLRLGIVDARALPRFAPICLRCYVRQATATV